MEAPEIKEESLAEQGKRYLAQLEEDAKPHIDLEHRFNKMYSDRIKELFEKKDNEPK